MNDFINFVYVGRLEHEKGFDLIIEVMKQLFFENVIFKDKIRIFIFGDGKLKKNLLDGFDGVSDVFEGDLETLMKGEYKSVNFFGRQSRQIIDDILSKSQFSFIPSRFLETFGLVGLESCQKGVNVIGFSKGGLKDFILPELDISKEKGRHDLDKFYNLISKICFDLEENDIERLSNQSKKIAEKFTLENWMNSFKEMFHGQNVLLVSDFLPKIGGIEVYIQNVADVLRKNGYKVEVFGRDGFFGKVNKYAKMFALPMGGFNFVYAYLLNKKIKEFKPDLVRYNSVLRFLGRAPLCFNNKGNFQKWIMYHDLGCFTPYPSKTYDEKVLNKKFNLKNFFGQVKHFNLIRLFSVFLKFLSCYSIYLNIRGNKMNKHLVPSDFMTDVLIHQYALHREQITVLPHFSK